MPTLTQNLFYGCDEGQYELSVGGEWPDDIAGQILNVGPQRSRPDGHWFAGQGFVQRTHCQASASGKIEVELRAIETPLAGLRRRNPELFRRQGVLEVSPFGYSNFANTNVQVLGDRVFLGYDAGRPIEIDPITLEFLTPVGRNAEWLQSLPASVEPLIAVAAHPAPSWDESALYFANYEMIPLSAERELRICRWGLEGEVEHWRLAGAPAFDSIHDVKATKNFVVISDLPFGSSAPPDPAGLPRPIVGDRTTLWIIAKSDLRATPHGEAVPHRTLEVPMMAGHMTVAYDDDGSEIRLHLAHHPITDLAMCLTESDRAMGSGTPFADGYLGLPATTNQPCGFGTYRIDAVAGKVIDTQIATPPPEFFGGLLFSQDLHREAARTRPRHLWVTSTGFDPELVSERWWQSYAEVHENVFVAPRDFPKSPIPGALARVDLEAGAFTDVYSFEPGTFCHPGTFVPRAGSDRPDDGYVIATVHRDGDKALAIFDALDLAAGPIATASAPGFNPPLLLHAYWAPHRVGPRPSDYAVDPERDAWETLAAFGENPNTSIAIGKSIFDGGTR